MSKPGEPPKVLPPVDYVVQETVVIDGKVVRILSPERDVNWQRNKRPRYSR